jgi:UDP-2,4-diacetamido-2,4,6-trideoxy-beta-L-altropyranose hydrolase
VKETLVFRVDASSEMGIGHVMRCLALAQAWQDIEGDSFFVMSTGSPALETRLKSEGIEVLYLSTEPGSKNDACQTATLACQMNARWVVVDGYHFSGDYQRIIKDSGRCLLFIDDYGHASHYWADVVLNQNLHAHERFYEKRELHTKLLLGSNYVLLRHEFLQWRGRLREFPEMGRKVLVTLGGGDTGNVTLNVIQGLEKVSIPDMEVSIVVGPTNSHQESIRRELARAPFRSRLWPSARNMVGLMAWADVAVSAAGSTTWELAFMGLTGVLLIVAENQRGMAQVVEDQNVFVVLALENHFSTQDLSRSLERLMREKRIRQNMSQKASLLVDGMGAKRVIQTLIAI